MVSGGMGPYGQHSGTIDLWRATNDGFERVYDTRFDGGGLGIPLLRWINSTRVDVCWRGEDSTYLGFLQLEHGEWVRGVDEE
jgi:hypothetical protein